MIIQETQDGDLAWGDPLEKGIVIFPENEIELKYIEYILEEEILRKFKFRLEIDAIEHNE
jgi:hypothetical protein